ncbi:patatin-like phospholipase family protein [Thermaurantiacus sp.]
MSNRLEECDLVMRGGITSGVVYPGVLAELARHYRFRNIGGASAGAIAAGVAAAAEHGRQSGACPRAFEDVVARLPDELGGQEKGEGGTDFRTIFRPAEELAGEMALVWTALEKGPFAPRALAHLLKILKPSLRPVVPTAAVLAALAGGLGFLMVLAVARPGAPGAAVVALVSGAAFALLAFALAFGWLAWIDRRGFLSDLGRPLEHLKAAGFGLCPGINPDIQGREDMAAFVEEGGFADWMHATIQRAAGRAITDPPLTVGDLWGTRDPASERKLDLLLTTTNLSQQLPHQFPFLERSSSFLYFAAEDLERVLPKRVVAHLVLRRGEAFDLEQDGIVYHRLPPAADLPVLLGVRLSMSFPLLISAVRLFECRAFTPGEDKAPRLCPCWFSDGGITSNFPVSTFDTPFPSRPTFCIDLADLSPDDPLPQQRVRMARTNSDWVRAPHRADIDKGGLGGFLGAIVDTARNGHENELMTLPSQRDRIVRVLLNPESEGGLNLAMSAATIGELKGHGAEAGRRLWQRFHPEGGGDPEARAMTWNLHRWGRIRTTLAGLEALSVQVAAGWERADREGRRVPEILALSRRFTNYRWPSQDAWKRAVPAAERLAAEAKALADLASPRPDDSVFDGVRAEDGESTRKGGAPRPTMRFQLRAVGRDPRRS